MSTPPPRAALEHPLLGRSLAEARRALDAHDSASDPRLRMRRLDLARLDDRPEAAAELDALAADLAEAEPRLAWLCRVQAARWRLEDGAPDAPLPPRPPGLPPDPEVEAEEALLDACRRPHAARAAWRKALDGLPRPARDHDRLAVHELLAQAEREVGDRTAARRHLERALELARRHESPEDEARLCWLQATLLLETGHGDAARPLLERLLELAPEDGWMTIAAATTLSALLLARGEHQAAAPVAARQARAARARQSWLAAADAAMTQAACELAFDRPVQALRGLLQVATEARAAGVEPAVNLVKARLAELREELGPGTFDPALQAASKPE